MTPAADANPAAAAAFPRQRGTLTAIMLLGGALPVPLYVLFEARTGFGPLGVTDTVAAYVIGTLVVLLGFNDLGRHIGRKAVLALAVAAAVASTVIFLSAASIAVLILARVLGGLAAGLLIGSVTATLAERYARADRRTRAEAADVDSTGMGLGSLVAGVFAAFTLLGLFSSLVPAFVRGLLGVGGPAVIGAANFLIFVIAGSSLALSARLECRRWPIIGPLLLFAGLAVLEASLFAGSVWMFLAAAVAGGIAIGLLSCGGLSEILRQAEPERRAEAASTFFAAAYLGLGLPVVLVGVISVAVAPVDASAWVAGLVAVAIIAAVLLATRTPGTKQVAPAAEHRDSWHLPQPTDEPSAREQPRSAAA